MSVPKVGASQWLEQVKQTQMRGDEQGIPSVHPYIFTVPEPLRTESPEAYLPHVVSLGPYHHRKLELYESERYKSRLTVQVEKRANRDRFESLVTDIISSAREIRNCYNEYIDCDDEVLGWMMARDAVFILEFLGCFGRYQTPRVQHSSPRFGSFDEVFDPEKKSPFFFPLRADVFKLENQIPLSILKKVLMWETGSESHDRLRRGIIVACTKFSPFVRVGGSYRSIIAYDNLLDETHILECLYNAIVPPQQRRDLSSSVETVVPVQGHGVDLEGGFSVFSFLRIVRSGFRVLIFPRPKHKADGNLPSASELQRRGVKFEPFTWGIGQIRFDRASCTVFLPCIEMDYRTDVFLRNLVALEAFMKCKTRVLTCYVDLMDKLIDTPHDVAVLKKYGVMYSNLGCDKEVSNLWNGISRSIWRSAYEPIDQTIRDVNSYYRSKYRVMLGEIMHEHFSKPWRAASVVGACILLLLAFIQTLFSYYQLRQNGRHL